MDDLIATTVKIVTYMHRVVPSRRVSPDLFKLAMEVMEMKTSPGFSGGVTFRLGHVGG
jgi:hypothetical protein